MAYDRHLSHYLRHMSHDLHVCIMAGGVGSRFWPASRSDRPKQFLHLIDADRSMLQCTYDRYRHILPAEQISVITSIEYADETARQLPELSEHQIIIEPYRRNTAAASLLAATAIERWSSGTVCLLVPSDAVVQESPSFYQTIAEMHDYLRSEDRLSTIGMRPTSPHTGYGYIAYERRAESPYHVSAFIEKPDRATAIDYLNAGNYLWNSGIYGFRTDYYLQLFNRLASDMYHSIQSIEWQEGGYDKASLDAVYRNIQNVSMDYLISERTQDLVVFPGDFNWSDIGSWSALHEYKATRPEDNVSNAPHTILEDTRASLIHAPKDMVVIVKGLDGYAVVQEGNSLLIYPLADDQEIKQLRSQVHEQYGEEYI